jgi:PPOX class probable F420-dependent enzyme
VTRLTEAQLALLRGRSFGVVATLRTDGAPQTSVVWVDTDGKHVVFNTTSRRAKGRNLRRDPRLSVTVYDPRDPYRYFEVQGAATLEPEGADDHIHVLSRKYSGTDFHTPVDRVIVKVRPQRIFDYNVS